MDRLLHLLQGMEGGEVVGKVAVKEEGDFLVCRTIHLSV